MTAVKSIVALAIILPLAAMWVCLASEGDGACEPPSCVVSTTPSATPLPMMMVGDREPTPHRDLAPAALAPAPVHGPAVADPTPAVPAPAAAAERSPRWEELHRRLEQRLAALIDRPRATSLAFTDFVQREGFGDATLTDAELADLFDAFAQLALQHERELEPLQAETGVASECDEARESRLQEVQERFALGAHDLARGFASR